MYSCEGRSSGEVQLRQCFLSVNGILFSECVAEVPCSAPVEAKVWYSVEGDSSVRWFDWFFHCVFSENSN